MIAPNSRVILLRSPLEPDNLNQLTFTNATAQYNYFYGLTKKELEDSTFQRKDNTIRFPTDEYFNFDDVQTYNYCMYQNTNYSDKWFYAFIEKCTYINDGMSEIKIKTDVWQTWQFDLTFKASFVEREHIAKSSDTIGANTIPESLELGEYAVTDYWRLDNSLKTCYICIGVSSLPANFPSSITLGSRIYNGVYSGLRYFIFKDESSASKFIRGYDSERMAEAIYTIFLVPTGFITSSTTTEYEHVTIGTQTDITLGVYLPSDDPISLFSTQQISIPNNLNGYTPKNNKLFTYPYSYMYITNNCGGDVTYNYEDFNGLPVFACDGALCVGCSIKLYPRNYKKLPVNDTEKRLQYTYGINGGKYPTCSWASDSFTNWITQNAINLAVGVIGGGAAVAAGVMSGGTALATIGMTAGGLGSIVNSLNQVYQHSAVPEQAKGNTNSGDVVTSGHEMGFTLFNMSVKYEYAKIIDDFFDMYGYKTHKVKVPNLNNRSNWNYIQTINCNVVGNVPQNDIEEIKNIFNTGVTLWHTTTHFLDYTQTNS